MWKGQTLRALVSDNPLSHDLGLGGFEAKGDCTVLRSELGADRPKLGETLEFQDATYRITLPGSNGEIARVKPYRHPVCRGL